MRTQPFLTRTFWLALVTTVALVPGEAFVGSNPWSTKAPMPTARVQLAVAAGDGVLYAVGGDLTGGSGSPQSRLEAYDPLSDSWTLKPPMPTPRNYLSAAVIDGILYAVGGFSGSPVAVVEAYDPLANTWTTKAPMPGARYHFAVGVVGGILYAVGGNNGNGWVSTVQAYNPRTNTWTNKSAMPTARGGLAVGVIDGILYAIGGYGGGCCSLATVEAYDPASDTWATKAQLPSGRSSLAAAVLGNKLYAVGGGSNAGLLASVDVYDPASNTWTADAPMPTPRAYLAADTLHGAIYAVGGQGANGVLATTEAFAPDRTPPTLALPNELIFEATSAAGAVATYTASALDDVDGPVTPDCIPEPGTVLPIGRTDVECTATDSSNNTSTGYFSVIVRDTTPPVLTLPGSIERRATGPSGAVVTYTASATDHVDGTVPLSCAQASGMTFSVGTTDVICSARDAAGNTATGAFTVTVRQAVTHSVTATIPVPGSPRQIGVDPNSGWIYVANHHANNVSVIDGASDTVRATIALPPGGPEGLAVNRVTRHVYVSHHSSNSVSVIDAATDSFSSSFGGLSNPMGAAVNPATNRLYVGNTGSDAVWVFDLTTNTVLAQIGIGGDAYGLDVDSARNLIYAPVAGTARVAVIDGSTLAIVTTIPVGLVPLDVAVDEAARRLYVANRDSSTVSVVDTTTNAVIETVPVPSGPYALAVNAVLNLVYVAQSGGASVAIIDGTTNTVVATVPVGLGPARIEVNPQTHRTYVANTASNTISVIESAPLDTSAPVLDLPDDVVAEATGPNGAFVSFEVSASDDADSAPVVTCAPGSGSLFPIGTTPVTCTATDESGNSAARAFTVTVGDTTPPSAVIVSPTTDAVFTSSAVTASVQATDAVGVAAVTINGTTASLASGTPQTGTWVASVGVTVAASNTFNVTIADTAGNSTSVGLVADGDGIAAAIDRNLSTDADEPHVYSSEYAKAPSDPSRGRIEARGNWFVRIDDVPGLPVRGSVAPIGNEGYSQARISACGGSRYKEIRFDAGGEAAEWRCDSNGTLYVKAVQASPRIEVYKYGCSLFTGCRVKFLAGLTTGQSISTGSPFTADPGNTEPVTVLLLDEHDVPFGSFALDPGETVDVEVQGPPGSEEVIVTVLAGTVDVTISGLTETLTAGNPPATFTHDTVAPIITAPDVTVEATSESGAVVTFAPAVTDAVDPAPTRSATPASGSQFPLGTTTVTVTAVDAAGNQSSTTFAVIVITAATTTTVSTTPNPSTYGQSVNITAAVIRTGGIATAGTVTFTEASSVLAGPIALDASGRAGVEVTMLPAGNHTIVAVYSGGSIFNASSGSTAHAVTKAALTVTADNHTRLVGAPNPPLTASYAGFVNGDTPATLDVSPTLATTATTNSGAGIYAIEVSGASDANYTIGYRPGTLTVTNSLCLLYDPSKPARSGSTIPIKLQLCTVDGGNLSSPAIALTAHGIRSVAGPSTGVHDAGNANPGGQFRYDASLGGYILNLKAGGLPAGTYRLLFTASGDPLGHDVEFRIR